MSRVIEVLSVGIFLGAALAFVLSVLALSAGKDLNALYWGALGAVLLKAAVDLLRPARSS